MDLLNQARAVAGDERAELEQLRAARAATEKAQRVANSLRDEYETLLLEVEREKNDVLQAQVRRAEDEGNAHALGIIEDLRAARMSLGRRDGQQQLLQQQLAKARMSCTRHRNVARSLQEEAELFSMGEDTSAANVRRLTEENKTLKDEVRCHEEQAARALESAAAKDGRIASLEAQCAMLTSRLHGVCLDASAANAKIRESVAQVAEIAAPTLASPEENAARLAAARAQCERLSADLQAESRRLADRAVVVGELEALLSQSRDAVAKRDCVIEEQLASLGDLQKKLAAALEDTTTKDGRLKEVERELAVREGRIVQLTEDVAKAGKAVEESAMFTEFRMEIDNLKHALAGARLSTQRRDHDILSMTTRRENEAHAEQLHLAALQDRCEHAEEEARLFFVQAEELAEMAGDLQKARLSTARHVEAEGDLRGQLDALQQLVDVYENKQREHEEVTRKLEAEHKSYCATLYEYLNKEKAASKEDVAVLEAQVRVLEKEKADWAATMDAMKTNLQTMLAGREEARKESAALQVTIDDAEAVMDEKAALVAAAERAVAERDAQLQEKTAALAAAQAALSEAAQAKAALEADAAATADEMVKLEMEVGLREITMAEMQEALSNTQHEANAARLSVARRADTIEDKTKELSTAKKAFEKAKRDLAKFKMQAEKLPVAQKEAKEMKKAAQRAEEQWREEKAAMEHTLQEMRDEYHAAMQEKEADIAALQANAATYKEQSCTLMDNAERQAQELKALRQRETKQDSYREKLEKMVKVNQRLKERLLEKQRETQLPSPSPVVPFEIDASYRCAAKFPTLRQVDLDLEPPNLSYLSKPQPQPQPEETDDQKMFVSSPSTSPVLRKPARRHRRYARDEDAMPAPALPEKAALAKKTSRLSLRI